MNWLKWIDMEGINFLCYTGFKQKIGMEILLIEHQEVIGYEEDNFWYFSCQYRSDLFSFLFCLCGNESMEL